MPSSADGWNLTLLRQNAVTADVLPEVYFEGTPLA